MLSRLRKPRSGPSPMKPNSPDHAPPSRSHERPLFLLQSRPGIAVYPGSEYPRLPLLGLRAIGENRLTLKMDGVRREAALRTPIRWWPFA